MVLRWKCTENQPEMDKGQHYWQNSAIYNLLIIYHCSFYWKMMEGLIHHCNKSMSRSSISALESKNKKEILWTKIHFTRKLVFLFLFLFNQYIQGTLKFQLLFRYDAQVSKSTLTPSVYLVLRLLKVCFRKRQEGFMEYDLLFLQMLRIPKVRFNVDMKHAIYCIFLKVFSPTHKRAKYFGKVFL